LADKLDPRARPAFESKARWASFARERHSKVARNFSAIVMIPATVLPAVVLRATPSLALGYVAVTIVTTIAYSVTANLAIGLNAEASSSALPRS
jgi:hypothetical protein